MKYRIFVLFIVCIMLFTGCTNEEITPKFNFSPYKTEMIDNTVFFAVDLKTFTQRLSDINKELYNDASPEYQSWIDIGQTTYTENNIPYKTYIYRIDQKAYLHPAISIMCTEKGILKVNIIFHEESLTSYTEDTYKRFITICAIAFYPKCEWKKLTQHIEELYNEPYFAELSALEQKYYENNSVVSTAVAYAGTRTVEFFPYDERNDLNYRPI